MAVTGIHGRLVEVEADVSPVLPHFYVSGMPDASCKQAPDRIRAAANNTELELPKQRITVNLSPASLPKHGSGFDLAIAIAVLVSGGTVKPDLVSAVVHLGELGLYGTVRPIAGVLVVCTLVIWGFMLWRILPFGRRAQVIPEGEVAPP